MPVCVCMCVCVCVCVYKYTYILTHNYIILCKRFSVNMHTYKYKIHMRNKL